MREFIIDQIVGSFGSLGGFRVGNTRRGLEFLLELMPEHYKCGNVSMDCPH